MGGVIKGKGAIRDKDGNYNYNALMQVANSEVFKSRVDEVGEAYLNALKAGKAKFYTAEPDGTSRFSTSAIPLTRHAEFSGKYVLQ
jgi:hypothetical protein